jgi:hypothetical protein
MSLHPNGSGELDLVHRPLPPIAHLGMLSMALIVGGGVYLAANLPHHVSLVPAIVLLVAAAGLAGVNTVLLATLKDFAWPRFVQVAVRMFVAYLVIAGMIEYVFVLDHTPGKVILVMTLMLLVFAIDIPTILGFTVARYSDPRGD